MRIRFLGWAGLEIEARGTTIVVDAIAGLGIMGRLVGEARGPLLAPEASRRAAAALVTHLHRDHLDPEVVAAALAPEGLVLRPPRPSFDGDDARGVAQGEAALDALGQESVVLRPWEEREVGPFRITAFPAVDGFGDQQVGWHVTVGEHAVVHAGDTLMHGAWWTVAAQLGAPDVAFLPVNGPVVSMPHRMPASDRPAAMTPEDAATAGRLLRAGTVVPIHFGTMHQAPQYVQAPDVVDRLRTALGGGPPALRVLEPGDVIDLAGGGAGGAGVEARG